MPKKSIIMRIKHINLIRRGNFINNRVNGIHIMNSFPLKITRPSFLMVTNSYLNLISKMLKCSCTIVFAHMSKMLLNDRSCCCCEGKVFLYKKKHFIRLVTCTRFKASVICPANGRETWEMDKMFL